MPSSGKSVRRLRHRTANAAKEHARLVREKSARFDAQRKPIVSAKTPRRMTKQELAAFSQALEKWMQNRKRA